MLTVEHSGTVAMCQTDTLLLPPQPRSPGLARAFVGDRLRRWGLAHDPEAGDVADNAVLVISELVTNAVQYTDGPVELALALHHDYVDMDVHDCDPTPPRMRHAIDTSSEVSIGRGMAIVMSLCDYFDLDQGSDGKTIHVRLDIPRQAWVPGDCQLCADPQPAAY